MLLPCALARYAAVMPYKRGITMSVATYYADIIMITLLPLLHAAAIGYRRR